MQFNNDNYTECPACHAQWRDIEITMQACESCLFIAMPLVAATDDINQHFADKADQKKRLKIKRKAYKNK